MTTDEIRKKYLDFFKKPPRSHKQILAAPLVLENDSTTLFTSAGMQPLIPYLMGQKHPEGKRLVNSQPAIRTQDIEEVGDNRHTTFFEMLGNWSLGDYFKKEQLSWIWEFLTKELKLPNERLYVTTFSGNKETGVPEDTESVEIWKKIGVLDDHIFSYGVEENWWSRSGAPDKMPVGEIGGPSSEVFFEFTQVKHDKKFGETCHPVCDCGRFLEIGNCVFIEYKKEKDGSLSELQQKNIDFGGGLERLAAATNNDPDVFKIDVFQEIIKKIEEVSGKKYQDNKKSFRIIADHMRASEALIKAGVGPSNKLQGYVLRRLIRRAAVKIRDLREDLNISGLGFAEDKKTARILDEEFKSFERSMDIGFRKLQEYDHSQLNPLNAFGLYQSYGFPIEVVKELYKARGIKINKKFEKELKDIKDAHSDLSKKAAVELFKGRLAKVDSRRD